MNYKAFYAEIAEWVYQINQNASKHGMDSDAFWSFVMTSAVAICNKYNNNDLVKKQMVMMYLWLEDVYAQVRSSKRG